MKKTIKAATQSRPRRDTSIIHQLWISFSAPYQQRTQHIMQFGNNHNKQPAANQKQPLFLTTTHLPIATLVSAIVWGLATTSVYADVTTRVNQHTDTHVIATNTTDEKYATLNSHAHRPANHRANPPHTLAYFDVETLKSRGFDPQIANYFSQAPRFREGRQTVTLLVNGQKRGVADAQFSQEGTLCLSLALINLANLVPPSEVKESSGNTLAQTSCFNTHPDFKKVIIELHPQRGEVALIVPTDRLLSLATKPSNYRTGGAAGLINYELFSITSQYKDYSNNYFSAATDLGFNMGNWIVRSRQSYQKDNASSTFTHLYAYAQKTLVDYDSTFQAGQLNIAQSTFFSVPITGVQIFPETALSETSSSTTQVNGIAQTQARIEVRQIGALIYSTLVPAGPFSLNNIPLLNGSNDLHVTVIEADGQQHAFVVPAAAIQSTGLSRPGYSLALGKIRDVGNTSNDKRWITAATGVWPVARGTTTTAGLMATNAYQGLGGGIDWAWQENSTLSWRNLFANAQQEKVRGIRTSLSINTTVKKSLWAALSVTQQTPGYRDALDSNFQEQNAFITHRYQGQYTATVGWTNMTLGGFNLSYTYATARTATEVTPTSKRLTGVWSKTFPRASVTLNIEKNFNHASASDINSDAVYLNIHIPFGSRNVKTYMNHREDRTRIGATFNEQVNEYVNYSIQAEHDKQNEQVDVSGNLALLPRYTQINLGYARSGSTYQSYNGQLRGGIALHQRGVTFSPYAVQDTFGIVSVGDVAGVKISTPNGPVWTDRWGKAVVSQFPAYKTGRIEVATKTLPRNVDLANGLKMIEAGRGSVNAVDFQVIKVRRALLLATDPQGQPMTRGASVIRADNSFVTAVGSNGQIFLSNNQLGEKLRVALSDTTLCELKFTLPEKIDTQMYYEKINATCQLSETSNKKIK